MKHWLINPNHQELPLWAKLSDWLALAWEDIDPTQVWDCHAHLAGSGDSGGGAWFTPKMNSLRYPMLWRHKQAYMNAGGVRDTTQNIDQQYVQLMVHMPEQMPEGVKVMLLAFDYAHDERGRALPGVMPLNSPRVMARAGLLPPEAVLLLETLKLHNALLYDFTLKRLARYNGKALPASVFETRRFFETVFR